MKNQTILFNAFFASILFLVAACSKEKTPSTNNNASDPVADFSIAPNDTIPIADEFTLTNTSTNADEFTWSYGDGGVSSVSTGIAKSYRNNVLTSGYHAFQITLTAKKGTKTSTKTKMVYVYVAPIVVPASIIGTWNLDGGKINGYSLSKDSITNTYKFRSDNQLERNINTSYQTSCGNFPGPCSVRTWQYDFNDILSYSTTSSSVTFDTRTWQSTITANTLILEITPYDDSLHFSR